MNIQTRSLRLSFVFILTLILNAGGYPSQALSQGGMKSLYVTRDVPKSETPNAMDQKQSDALSRALEKYKQIDSGEMADTSTEIAPEKRTNALPPKPERVAIPKLHNPTPPVLTPARTQEDIPKSGFAQILQDYRESKERRSKIRSMTITDQQ